MLMLVFRWFVLTVVRPCDTGVSAVISDSMWEEDVPVWVKRRAKGFGRFLEVSCAGFEDKIVDLLLDIEKKWRTSREGSSKKKK